MSIASEKAKSAVLERLNSLNRAADMDGSIDAWRERLCSGGLKHEIAASSLINHARKDRIGAAEFAAELDSWGLYVYQENNPSELVRVVKTLVRFPEEKQLIDYLKAHSVSVNKTFNKPDVERAVLVEDYLSVYGHAYRFDGDASMFPIENHELMKRITARSELETAVFSEVPPDEYNRGGSYVLKASMNGKSYEAHSADHGSYYNCTAIVDFLNVIAAHQRLSKRYVLLSSEMYGTEIFVWATEPSTLFQFLFDGLIELSGDYSMTLCEGRSNEESEDKYYRLLDNREAFEERMLEFLR